MVGQVDGVQYWHARAACSRAAASRKSSRRAATHSSAGVPSGGGAAAAARSAADGGAPVAASSGERARRAAAGSAAEAVAGRARGCGREGKKEMRAARECASAPRWGCARVLSSLSLSLSLSISHPFLTTTHVGGGQGRQLAGPDGHAGVAGRREEEGGKSVRSELWGRGEGSALPFSLSGLGSAHRPRPKRWAISGVTGTWNERRARCVRLRVWRVCFRVRERDHAHN